MANATPTEYNTAPETNWMSSYLRRRSDGRHAWRSLPAALALAVTMAGHGSFAATTEVVPLFISATHASQEGFVRIINHSDQRGMVAVTATDDAGRIAGTERFSLGPWETKHFNSGDLEDGNARKGLVGVGSGRGDWRLEVESDLPLEVLAYVRTSDGFLTSMHDKARKPGLRHLVPVFNPGSNRNQVSKLRIVNVSTAEATVGIVGVDDGGVETDETSVAVAAGEALTLTAQELEAGEGGLTKGLADGSGKWQLYVHSDQRIIVQSLLESATGHLTNLSTSASAEEYAPPSEQPAVAAAGDFALDDNNIFPNGIAYADGVFYVLDRNRNKVFGYTRMGARHTESDFPVSVTFPDGLAYANGRLYVAETGLSRNVLAYTTDGRRTPVLDSDFQLGDDVVLSGGIAHANGRFYVLIDQAATSDSRLLEQDHVRVYAESGQEVAEARFDLALGGDANVDVAHANGRLYVLGGGAVYAYSLSGEPAAGHHFDLTRDNGDPQAIAYANGRFYVTDGIDGERKVFAYTAAGRRVE